MSTRNFHRSPQTVPELYVADRVNTRVLVYDIGGRYLRSFGEQFLNSPSDFAQWGDLLVVAELYGRVAVLDPEDNLLGYIGDDPTAAPGWPTRPGWPNTLAGDGVRRYRTCPATIASTPRTLSQRTPTEISMCLNGFWAAVTPSSPSSAERSGSS
nr:hypothetical protein [Mycobacterium intracellulare]